MKVTWHARRDRRRIAPLFSQATPIVPANLLYTVTPAAPRAHVFVVCCELAAPDPRGQIFRLPAWLRGSYLVRDFAKHVSRLRAHYRGVPATIERLDKSSFRVSAGEGPLTVDYEVYAFDASVRKAWLDTRRGFFNGSSLFYCPVGHDNGVIELELRPPTDEDCQGWCVATSLPAVDVDARGFGRYRAEDYEALIDHPVELGRFQRHDFMVDGIPHALVLSGRVDADTVRVTNDLARICEVERALFGHQPVLDQYLFLTNVVTAGYGGLEHRSSTALICSRGDLPDPGAGDTISTEYRQFLGLCSHEYFHLWNVKRICAQRFLESRLEREAYTEDLWHYEGVTSYYDDLFLLRAGLIEPAVYLDLLAQQATRVERGPGRNVQTLADASFETWIKYYQPDENAPNANTNYYAKGAVVAACLDLHLRRYSSISLDDVMRGLWQRYGAVGVGVPERGLEQLAQELSGLDLGAFFERCLRSTQEPPLAELLAEFGVRAERRAAHSPLDPGGRNPGTPPAVWTGLKLRPGELRIAQVLTDSPAQKAGLAPGDELIALDGLRLNANQWLRSLERATPGQTVDLHYFRDAELLRTTIRFTMPPMDSWTLTCTDADPQPLQRRQAWLATMLGPRHQEIAA